MMVDKYLEKKFGSHASNPQRLEGFLRKDMYRMFGELGLTVGLEIGIEKGKNAQEMYEQIPDLKLYGLDSYKQHPYASYVEVAVKRNWDPKEIKRWKAQCLKRMAGRNFTMLEGFSEDMISQVPDFSLDFVYIDADHSYDFVMQDMILWGRKLKKGGVMSGHDYYDDVASSQRRTKVKQAVDDYVKVHGINLYVTGEVHKMGMGDYYPSWFWVKLEDIYPNVIRKKI